METDKGTETLIDYQSYSAGYRQAVCDLVNPIPELKPTIWLGIIISIGCVLAIIKEFGAYK